MYYPSVHFFYTPLLIIQASLWNKREVRGCGGGGSFYYFLKTPFGYVACNNLLLCLKLTYLPEENRKRKKNPPCFYDRANQPAPWRGLGFGQPRSMAGTGT